jgi:hypothetical protein
MDNTQKIEDLSEITQDQAKVDLKVVQSFFTNYGVEIPDEKPSEISLIAINEALSSLIPSREKLIEYRLREDISNNPDIPRETLLRDAEDFRFNIPDHLNMPHEDRSLFIDYVMKFPDSNGVKIPIGLTHIFTLLHPSNWRSFAEISILILERFHHYTGSKGNVKNLFYDMNNIDDGDSHCNLYIVGIMELKNDHVVYILMDLNELSPTYGSVFCWWLYEKDLYNEMSNGSQFNDYPYRVATSMVDFLSYLDKSKFYMIKDYNRDIDVCCFKMSVDRGCMYIDIYKHTVPCGPWCSECEDLGTLEEYDEYHGGAFYMTVLLCKKHHKEVIDKTKGENSYITYVSHGSYTKSMISQ